MPGAVIREKHRILAGLTEEIKRVWLFGVPTESLAERLDMLPVGVRGLKSRDRWDLYTCIRVAHRLGLRIEFRVRTR